LKGGQHGLGDVGIDIGRRFWYWDW